MANTYSSLYYHLIFSTKNRIHWIHPEIQHRVWAYLGGIARRHKRRYATRGSHISLNRALKGPARVTWPLRGPEHRGKCTNSRAWPSRPCLRKFDHFVNSVAGKWRSSW